MALNVLNILYIYAAELIKKHEQDEPRPLYMDFQATTPMVTVTKHFVTFTRFYS